jgi:hypothetical protein
VPRKEVVALLVTHSKILLASGNEWGHAILLAQAFVCEAARYEPFC